MIEGVRHRGVLEILSRQRQQIKASEFVDVFGHAVFEELLQAGHVRVIRHESIGYDPLRVVVLTDTGREAVRTPPPSTVPRRDCLY